MSDDASPTYRGFRHQALYILYRLLTDEKCAECIYRPEGAEDLSIYDSGMRLIEVVQVKDYSSDLALSNFKPKSDGGFFARLNKRRIEHPYCETKLASFGPLGPELSKAIAGTETERASIVKKLCGANGNIPAADARLMLDSLQGRVIHPVSHELIAKIFEALKGTSIGGDLESSLELLMYWIFRASENRRDITRQGIIEQFQRIGNFLVDLRDHSAEWGISLTAVIAGNISDQDRVRLIAEYRQGVQARWEHICAGADCLRDTRLEEIHKHLQGHSVVIIRGASGQGKSTLGWRYLFDYCAEGLRFHVRMVDDRAHAMRIANALGSHVRRLNLQAVVYLDVSPSDTAWSELVSELVSTGLKVVVAIREEDFRRANIAVGDFDYTEVILDRVTKVEAEAIFLALRTHSPSNLLDFDEAWERFASEEGGPLLEFTYLVTEGESLSSRIAEQIRRIQDEAYSNRNGLSQAHLELLALAAVANETGARVSLTRICECVGVNPLTRPLKILENEFLLRTQDNGNYSTVSGLHSLRSKAIVSALFSDAPELWESYAARVLPVIVDEDIESFLLAAFSRRADLGDSIFGHLLTLAPRSWAHASRIVRSLLWEGVSRYERRNQDIILKLLTKYDTSWWLLCDTMLGMGKNAHLETLGALADTFKTDIPSVSLSPKTEVFELLLRWAESVPVPPAPKEPIDWVGVGEIAHWLSHCESQSSFVDAIRKLLPRPIPKDLRIEELGKYISGRAQLNDPEFVTWHDLERQLITDKFLDETDSIYVSDDGKNVTVYFSLPLSESTTSDKADATDWHDQTIKRIRLLRLLFPHREIFGSQGFGLELFVGEMQHDPTSKNIPAKSLPLERSVWLNATFLGLVAYRHNRSNTWSEYASATLAFREAVNICFRKLHRSWGKLLSESPATQNTINQVPIAEMAQVNKLSKLPMYPRTAVDEWGFLSEGRDKEQISAQTMQQRSLRRFDKWRKAFSDYESSVGMVTGKMVDLTVLYANEENREYVAGPEDNKKCHLLLVNLASAWEVLRPMQQEFRKHWGHLYSQRRLDELEAHEQSNFRNLWAVAFSMCSDRRRHIQNICAVALSETSELRAEFLQALQVEINTALDGLGEATIHENTRILGESPNLCIVCNHADIVSVGATAPLVVEAAWRASHIRKWRSFEWKPLEIEWPKITFVNLIQGKAIAPTCSSVSTLVLFSTSEEFEVQLHHYAPLAVDSDDFARAKFTVWDSPLLRATRVLQGNVLAFVFTNSRFEQLATLVLEKGLNETSTARVLGQFSEEMETVLKIAQRSFAEMIQILNTIGSEQKTVWIEELKRICNLLLFNVDEDSKINLDVDSFVAWKIGFGPANDDFQKLMTEIVSYSLAE